MRIAPATLEQAPGIAAAHILSWQAAYPEILDSAYLQALSIESRTERWRDILKKADSMTLVASDGDDVLGFISFGPCRDEGAPADLGEIWALYARPDRWGQGVGRALLQNAVDQLRAGGHSAVSLWVLNLNQRGRRFYEACGFKPDPASATHFELGGRQVEEIRLLLAHGA